MIGALNALSGRVDYLDAYIIGREKMIRFYRQLVAAYPDARQIDVVQDNWSIHSGEQRVWQARAITHIGPLG